MPKNYDDEPNGEEEHSCPIFRDWPTHHQEARRMATRVNEMHGMVKVIADSAESLSNLGLIASGIRDLNMNLIGPATGKKQVSLISHLFIVAVLGTIIFLLLMKDQNKKVSIGPNGISIEELNGKKER